MKFLHIADLHIGKRLNNVSFLEDQIDILQQIATLADKHHVDSVLIAGDIYQTATPSAEAMAVFDHFLTTLVQQHHQVFLISGNHDSDLRISYCSQLLQKSNVYIAEPFHGTLQQISLSDTHGELIISLLPFVRPMQVRKYYPDANIQTYNDALREILLHSPIDRNKRNILVLHQFLTGGQSSDSDERSIGGLDDVSAELFQDFDYVACGHLHRPQRLLRDSLRYAGSPLKYSFSECNDKKSICFVDCNEKGHIQIKLLPLNSKHDMREVEGTYDELLAMDYSEDYIQATITSELVPPDAAVSISTVFPNLLKVRIRNSKTLEEPAILSRENGCQKSIEELFCDFYRLQNNDISPTEAHIDLLTNFLKELEESLYETN